MNDFLQSIINRDPAAKSKLSLILTYPGVKAVFFHRIANFFARAKFNLIARIISQFSRFLTGIEIHPNVTIYHMVTLGGIAPSINSNDQRNVKRHPSIQDDVVIGSGAQVLGPVTVGRCAKIGANAVITRDVPEKAVMVGIPAKNVGLADSEFKPYGITQDSDAKKNNE